MIVVEVADCKDTYLSPLPSKQLDVITKSVGVWALYFPSIWSDTVINISTIWYRSPTLTRAYVQSEETSPFSTRASSIPSLNELSDSPSVEAGWDRIEPGVLEQNISSGIHQSNENFATEDTVQFRVADVRKRLNNHSHTPKKMFNRDPDDPSG